jgi:oligopeptide transport system substrate-binding protein
MKTASIFSFSCLIVLTCLLSGCTKKETFADQAIQEKLLLIGNGAEPNSLDPAFTTTTRDENIMHAVFESLLILDPENLLPHPGVATHWEVSDNGRTYTFHLRHNARFSNGDPVTAKDFIFSLKRILSPHLDSPNAVVLYDIDNAKEYHEGKITDFKEVGIHALDNYTLQFALKNPNPFFTSIVASWFFCTLTRKKH